MSSFEMNYGAILIKKERNRQILEKGYTDEHDDTHDNGTLAVVAASLAVSSTDATIEDPLYRQDCWGLVAKHQNNRIRQLVIAGALIAAEIDREIRLVLDRK